jgi:orotidine-5'-phosphate decarboxylase
MIREAICLALDFDNSKDALDMIKKVQPYVGMVKVGLELFVSEGPGIIDKIHDEGVDMFLDLKFYDIPNTVAKACLAGARHNVKIINMHAYGGLEMMHVAVQEIEKASRIEGFKMPILAGVSLLTSVSQHVLNNQMCVNMTVDDYVKFLSKQAKAAGLTGMVTSPLEVSEVSKLGLITIVPGIRLGGDDVDDQVRIATPYQAVLNGADYLVVGRSITAAKDPEEAASKIYGQVNVALNERALFTI